jgi:hypothetical protein
MANVRAFPGLEQKKPHTDAGLFQNTELLAQ